ncbi:Trm112p-domain-containing protein, partial [Lactarius indigo]
LAHNFLACHAKDCTTNNFSPKFNDVKPTLYAVDFNPYFLRGFFPRIEWDALVRASREVEDMSLPFERPEMLDDDLLKQLHHMFLEVCAKFLVFAFRTQPSLSITFLNCGHVYLISDGIPNMLLSEHRIG